MFPVETEREQQLLFDQRERGIEVLFDSILTHTDRRKNDLIQFQACQNKNCKYAAFHFN